MKVGNTPLNFFPPKLPHHICPKFCKMWKDTGCTNNKPENNNIMLLICLFLQRKEAFLNINPILRFSRWLGKWEYIIAWNSMFKSTRYLEGKKMVKIFSILNDWLNKFVPTFSGNLGLPPTAITIFSAVIIVWKGEKILKRKSWYYHWKSVW